MKKTQPHFISLIVIFGLINQFTNENGIITQLLSFMGYPGDKAMLLQPHLFVPIYVLSGIWKEAGFSSVVYIAALAGVDQKLYEAANPSLVTTYFSSYDFILWGRALEFMV